MKINIGKHTIHITDAAELRSTEIVYHDGGSAMALKLMPREGNIWAILSNGDEISAGKIPGGVEKLPLEEDPIKEIHISGMIPNSVEYKLASFPPPDFWRVIKANLDYVERKLSETLRLKGEGTGDALGWLLELVIFMKDHKDHEG